MNSNPSASPRKSLNWKIAGKAGEGIMLSAKIFARACKRQGMQVFNYYEYPSLIKGGHQTGQVYAAYQFASCQQKQLDLLIALNENGIKNHLSEITDQTMIILNSDSGQMDKNQELAKKGKTITLPLVSITQQEVGNKLAVNILTLGISAALLGLNDQIMTDCIKEEFKDKGEEFINLNLKAYHVGKQQIIDRKLSSEENLEKANDDHILLTGNEAIGLGAIAAGAQYLASYPMTPTSSLMHYLAAQQEKYPLIVKHVEDEIAAIHQAMGAAFTGVRSMTCTSGGGFALMVEGLSMAGIAELPLVIVEGMRGTPATGMPTWTAQADLQFVLRAGHGDFPRVIFTPGTVEEHYSLTIKAFYLAEKYQIPVFILSDKYILESHQTMKTPAGKNNYARESLVEGKIDQVSHYLRYQITENGISPRSIPGQEHGLYLANSYEHDEEGFATEESEKINQQAEKRARKIELLRQELPVLSLIGQEKAPITLVSWGSTINVLLAVQRQKPEQVNIIHLPVVWPFPKEQFKNLARQAKRLIMIEGNISGQGEDLIKQETRIEFKERIRRYDGRPFYVEEIIDQLKI